VRDGEILLANEHQLVPTLMVLDRWTWCATSGDRDWGMREFRLFDPSNNLTRIAEDLGG